MTSVLCPPLCSRRSLILGGVFYSLDLLPEFWANVSRANPLVYVVNAFRYGVLGVSDVNIGFRLQ